MEKYLITLDLDGTTVPNLYDIGSYTVEVFKKLNELGHKIVIVTGRPFRSSYFAYYKMNLDTPIVNYNGCLITNPSDKSFKPFSFMMNRNDILDVYNSCKDMYSMFFTETDDNIFANEYIEDALPLLHINSLSTLTVGDLNKILVNDCHGCLILAKKNYGQKIVDYVKSKQSTIDARIWSWGSYDEIVELYSGIENKGTALLKVMQILNFDKEHVISCGDSPNDFDIFKLSGLTICPSNANKDIKKISDVVLDGDCAHESIAEYFDKRFNLGIKK